jgi:hypothetical protein
MPATEAQIRANQENSKKSTGPVTSSGKEASRANALKHGLTATVLLPEFEAAEVDRRFSAFANELDVTSEVGRVLARHAARMSVRMESCAEHQNVMMTARVRQALADYEVPEGLSEAEKAKLIDEVSYKASFDDSKEATLARKYEASAERGFFRALKELRILQKENLAADLELPEPDLGSILPEGMTDDEFDHFEAQYIIRTAPKPSNRVESDTFADLRGRIDVPLTIGQRS